MSPDGGGTGELAPGGVVTGGYVGNFAGAFDQTLSFHEFAWPSSLTAASGTRVHNTAACRRHGRIFGERNLLPTN